MTKISTTDFLPTFVVEESRFWQSAESGIDALKRCRSKQHFKQYPKQVYYRHNSRGFRDLEWPDQVNQAIWCVGDSFTVGLGTPFEHTWPQVLKQHTGRNVINISMDGASNTWISRKSCSIITEVNPPLVIIMWSYFHRREMGIEFGTDIQRRRWSDESATDEDNVKDFMLCLQKVVDTAKPTNTKLIHFLIPKASPVKDLALDNVENFLGEVPQLDWARDRHHFDLLTSQAVCDQILSKMSTWPDLARG